MSNFTARLCLFIVVASRSEKLPIVLSLPFCFCLHGGLRVFRLRLGCSKVSQFISRKSEILRRFSTGLFCAALRMLGAEGGGGRKSMALGSCFKDGTSKELVRLDIVMHEKR